MSKQQRLKRLVNIRQRVKTARQVELAHADSEAIEAHAHHQEALRVEDELVQIMLRGQEVSAEDMRLASTLVSQAGHARVRSMATLRERQEERDDAQKQVHLATRDERAMERLHQRAKDEARRRIEKFETEALDESASQRHGRAR